jgi:hypothetical protein
MCYSAELSLTFSSSSYYLLLFKSIFAEFTWSYRDSSFFIDILLLIGYLLLSSLCALTSLTIVCIFLAFKTNPPPLSSNS